MSMFSPFAVAFIVGFAQQSGEIFKLFHMAASTVATDANFVILGVVASHCYTWVVNIASATVYPVWCIHAQFAQL